MKHLRQSAQEFVTVRAPVIAVSALVALIAQMLNVSLPGCILLAALTQVGFFTLQHF
jgi:fatty acid desaturase